MFFASLDLVKLIVVYFFSASSLDSSQGLLKAVPEKNGCPHSAPKKSQQTERIWGQARRKRNQKRCHNIVRKMRQRIVMMMMMINRKHLWFKQPNKSRVAGRTGGRAKRRRRAVLGTCETIVLFVCINLPFYQKHYYSKVDQKKLLYLLLLFFLLASTVSTRDEDKRPLQLQHS